MCTLSAVFARAWPLAAAAALAVALASCGSEAAPLAKPPLGIALTAQERGVWRPLPISRAGIPVLLYHGIGERSDFRNPADAAYGVTRADFAKQMALLRAAGYDEPVFLHGALLGLTELYQGLGIDLGSVLPATGVDRDTLKGRIVLAPPAALADRWTRRLPDPVIALASGWMRVKQRAKARGVELPLVISDHADWDELTATLDDVGAGEIWVTHGREEALVHYAMQQGRNARALALTGFDEEEE